MIDYQSSTKAMSTTAWAVVFVVLFVAALPALVHLPIWVSIVALLSLTWPWLKKRYSFKSQQWLNKAVNVALLLAGLGGISLSFPSWFGGDAILSFFVIVVALKWSESHSQRDALLMIFAAVILSAIGGMYWQDLFSLVHMLLVVFLLLVALTAINDSANLMSWRALLSSVSVFFLLSLPLMALLFVTLPRIPGPIWDIGLAFGLPVNLSLKRDDKTPAVGKQLKSGQISRLSESEDVVLVAEFTNNYVPYKSQLYWRGPVFYDFDGVAWHLDEKKDTGKVMKSGGFKQKKRYDKAVYFKQKPINYSARVSAHNDHWLYALELVYGAFPETRISENFQLTAVRAVRHGEFKYEMLGYLDFEAGLPLNQQQRERGLFLPEQNNVQLQGLGIKIAEQQTTATGVMQAVLERLASGGFSFNEDLQLNDRTNDLDHFFFSNKQGNIMQFASSVVAIMRAAGVPTRLVSGFRGGDLIALTDFVIVRNKHAHVWPEVWLDGRGWVRMEVKDVVQPPVTEVRQNQGAKTQVDEKLSSINAEKIKPKLLGSNTKKAKEQVKVADASVESKPEKSVKLHWLDWEKWSNSLEKWVLNYNPNRQVELFSATGVKKVNWLSLSMWALIGVFALVLIYQLVAQLSQRQKRDPVDIAWQQFITKLEKLGIKTSTFECPSNLQQKIADTQPELAVGTAEVVGGYLDIRYKSADIKKESGVRFKNLVQRFISMV